MKLKFSHFALLLKRVKDTYTKKPELYLPIPGTASSVLIPEGSCVLILYDRDAYLKMNDALADAKQWTGINYPEILYNSTFIQF